jgi:hypothetical protein
MTPDKISLTLSKQEALVLFEWLAKVEPMGTTVFQHSSEERVLWKLQGQLESTLQEPFAPNYDDLVSQARADVEAGDT